MHITAVTGATWGDEGKGRVVDYLSSQFDGIVRFQGGKNAGHTVINPLGKFVLHLLPSGVFDPRIRNIIAPGVAFDGEFFLKELNELKSKGVESPSIMVSDRVQMVMPYHKLLDQYEELRLGNRKFGSTQSGIAPFYSQKYLKVGIQLGDLFDKKRLEAKVQHNLEITNTLLKHLYGQSPLSCQKITKDAHHLGLQLKPYIADTTATLGNMLQNNQRILLEGQLGALRDPDHGIYPFCSSSSPLAGYASVGAGIPPHKIRRIIGVVKAYATCVGEGPFITEIHGNKGELLRLKGGDKGEFGATTGRPRRVGHFDLVAVRYGLRIQGATEIALTCLDVLSSMEEIKVCTAYEIDGHLQKDFPQQADLERAKPVYRTLKGWKGDIRGATLESQLFKETKDFICFLEDALELKVTYISTGPERESMISL